MADSRSGASLEEFATAAFSGSGIRQDITLDEWKNGWAAIVGGINGKPTSQQFNMVTYVLSSLVNQAIADVASTTSTANDALPKSKFTAGEIVKLLSQYGLMDGCDADKLDGKHSDDFALSQHKHDAERDITSGVLPVSRGGTGGGTAPEACSSLGAMQEAGGTFKGDVFFANGTAHYVNSVGEAHFKSLGVSGDITAQRVYDAVYNDYAEFMPRGESTEPGDIIALDTNSQTERYIKATNQSKWIAGVHSNEYAMLIGGAATKKKEDFLEENLPFFIPVALAGRVHVKVIGPVHTGDVIVASEIPGVGISASPCKTYPHGKIVGYAVEGDDLAVQRLIKVRVGGC